MSPVSGERVTALALGRRRAANEAAVVVAALLVAALLVEAERMAVMAALLRTRGWTRAWR
jgi:hypothetical protein